MSTAWSSSRIRIASVVAVVVAALLGAAPPAHAFFCFGFSFGGGPRVSFGSGPRYYGPRPGYAPYGYYGHPGWRPAPYAFTPQVWRPIPPAPRPPYSPIWHYRPPR